MKYGLASSSVYHPDVLILADGRSNKDHMKNPYFLEVGGEPLIERTVRQFKDYGTVYIIGEDPKFEDLAHRIGGSDQSDKFFGIDMIRKALSAMSRPRTLVVFGDTYFTDEAVDIIKNHPKDDWYVFGRSGPSRFTNTNWAEYFAFFMPADKVARAWASMETVASFYMADEWYACTPWEWYHDMEDLHYHIQDQANVHVGPHWVEIDDLTDDVDFLADADELNEVLSAGN